MVGEVPRSLGDSCCTKPVCDPLDEQNCVTFQAAVLAASSSSSSAATRAPSSSKRGLHPGVGWAKGHDPAVSGVRVYEIEFVSTEKISTLTD